MILKHVMISLHAVCIIIHAGLDILAGVGPSDATQTLGNCRWKAILSNKTASRHTLQAQYLPSSMYTS